LKISGGPRLEEETLEPDLPLINDIVDSDRARSPSPFFSSSPLVSEGSSTKTTLCFISSSSRPLSCSFRMLCSVILSVWKKRKKELKEKEKEFGDIEALLVKIGIMKKGKRKRRRRRKKKEEKKAFATDRP